MGTQTNQKGQVNEGGRHYSECHFS